MCERECGSPLSGDGVGLIIKRTSTSLENAKIKLHVGRGPGSVEVGLCI